MVQNSDEIYITPDSYSTFYAYIQLIYGLEPSLDDENVEALEDWSDIFREPLLREICEEYNKRKRLRPTLSNVCSLYEQAINFGSNELENSCIEFGSINWMSIIRPNEFQSINEILGKRFLRSIIR